MGVPAGSISGVDVQVDLSSVPDHISEHGFEALVTSVYYDGLGNECQCSISTCVRDVENVSVKCRVIVPVKPHIHFAFQAFSK